MFAGTHDTRDPAAMEIEAIDASLAAKACSGFAQGQGEAMQGSSVAACAQPGLGLLLGASAPMRALFELITKAAPTRANVLIIGESGTGKELVAGEIHRMSRRSGEPLVAVNCSAIPPNLLEAEMFGYERGSFTGAVRNHKGYFERAAGGTLFLDEVSEMPLEMQAKLLRVLETGRFCRVGADREVEADVRVISATNRDLEQAVQAGTFRSDLLYRLNVFPIEVPPLRVRGEDLELLAQWFIAQFDADEGTSKTLSAASRQFLRRHHWPGNVRELRNAIQRAHILADDELDLAAAVGTASPPAGPAQGGLRNEIVVAIGCRLAEVERSVIYATLRHCGGNKTRTAALLGVSLKTLYNRLKEYQAEGLDLSPAVAGAAQA